ncbi:CBS domain containing protein [Oleidesulfovibrio alaskensis G20]|jgi:CBS domain-containing protein|uniref:CBS domain containing protein n=1 Tax=Oleidesulfovibrio alaskensis (strain ATCC BAA-1058 / DSM 17464 / G20) TaxID=207559 RepID=Q30Y46_OLEA2|nr:CBS domain-containing protein [Oleidesulfovibrio alaskensis]ABB39400.1 CBS domain containing protein [Oleidesulfovibrio alaskensis G20]MBG0772518.1 CBS domain-containing protein [Oleidesulfovibrio alaskensis]MBL3582120.1 CBS domain-containing protein [Oleidesulfovibrio alaskensis]
MLLRKRAWDIAREEFPVVRTTDSLAEAMRRLREFQARDSACICALVNDEGGSFAGAISVWDTMRFMERHLLRGSALNGFDESGFDRVFHNACKVAGSTPVSKIMDRHVTVLRPDEPLPLVLEQIVQRGRSYAVVKEGPKVIGVVMITDLYREISGEMT